VGAPAHCVVGAGPGGLVAAATLARAGVPVEVYERHSAVGQRFHGDFQGLENWSSPVNALDRLARLGVRTDFPHRAFTEVTFWDSRLLPTVARTEQPLFYLVRRGAAPDTLDQALLTQASDLGARVLLGRPAHTALEADAERLLRDVACPPQLGRGRRHDRLGKLDDPLDQSQRPCAERQFGATRRAEEVGDEGKRRAADVGE